MFTCSCVYALCYIVQGLSHPDLCTQRQCFAMEPGLHLIPWLIELRAIGTRLLHVHHRFAIA